MVGWSGLIAFAAFPMHAACVVKFHNLVRGPCSWSLELEVVHCYFDFVNMSRPGNNIVVIPLSKLRRACDYCSEIVDYFSVAGASEYLVAAQKINLCTGELGWSLDHTSKNSLIAPTTSVGSKQLKRALERVAGDNDMRVCKNEQSLQYLCSASNLVT